MNLQTIETLVRRLFNDATFRAQAIADPASALAEYRLAAEERTALTKLCVQLAEGPTTGKPTNAMWWF